MIQENQNGLLRAVCPHCKNLVKVDTNNMVMMHSIPFDGTFFDIIGRENIPDCEGSGQEPYLNHIKDVREIDMRRVPKGHVWTADPKTGQAKEIIP